MEQIPRGPRDKFCPLFRKRADKVCHTCMWWTLIKLDHPQEEGQKLFTFACAQVANVFTTMDAGRQQQAANKTVQEMAIVVQKGNAASHAAVTGMVSILNRVAPVGASMLPSVDEPKRLE